MEFAVIETGGKQYEVKTGDIIKIEKIIGDYKTGDAIVFDRVLLTDDGKITNVGTPYVSGVKITGTVAEIGRSKKVEIIRYKAKSNRFKRNGHRQPFFKVKIDSLV